MSSADLFEDGFPHGTKEGYQQGCRGAACPTGLELGLSCRDAHTRYHADYGFRKAVDRGATVAELAPGPPMPKQKVKGRTKHTLAGALPQVEEEIVGEAKKELRPEQHGTAYGYRQGCRDADSCPGLEGDRARSCVQAMQAWADAVKGKNAARRGVSPVVDVSVADTTQEGGSTPQAGAEGRPPRFVQSPLPPVTGTAAVERTGPREHGGLIHDLHETRRERDEAREALREAEDEIRALQTELGAARATIEAVRTAEEMRELVAVDSGPVTVHALYTEGRLSSVRVEVPQSA